jgi:small subunit ribosomal protein S6
VKRPYESVIVFDGTLSDDALHKEQAQVEEFLKQNAALEKVDVWGKRGLAYPIKKKRLGYYCLFIYEGEGGVINALERHLKLNEAVLRHLTVVRDLKNDAARAAFFARREKALAEASAAAAKAAEAAPAAVAQTK